MYKRWKCDECGALHRYRDDALGCCPTPVSEVYVCDKCKDGHDTEEAANACCAEPEATDETPNDAKDRDELEARGQLRLIG